MTKILCTIEGFAGEAKQIVEALGDVTYDAMDQENLLTRVADYDVVIVRLGLRIDRTVIDAGKHLKIIACPATGVDHLDIAYAETKGIETLTLKGETEFLNSVTATAELALGLMIALLRGLVPAHGSVLEGRWDRESFTGHSLRGKTLGIVGLGRLGKMMARYGKALEMEVIHHDRSEAGSIPLEDLLKQSDVVSLHVPLTKETEKMIGTAELAHLKPGAVIVNTARGKIVDEDAILAALKDGSLAGYAADVLADELSFTKDSAEAALIDYATKHTNVLLTPHIGGMTEEARTATDVFIARKLVETLR